jgi:pimeloyl-ACP methyl ester carboxylesterase
LIPAGGWPDPRIMRRLAKDSIRATPRGWTWKFQSDAVISLNQDKVPDDLGHVPVPVDFVYGEYTEIIPGERIAAIRRWLPTSAAPVIVSACHHHVMIEQPIALVGILSALLSRPVQAASGTK